MTATPSLQRLTVEVTDRRAPLHLGIVSDYFGAFSQQVHSIIELEWKECHAIAPAGQLQLDTVLCHFHALEGLTILPMHLNDHLIECLSAGPANPAPFLPHLRSLVVTSSSNAKGNNKLFQDELLLSMLRSRLKHGRTEGKNLHSESLVTASLLVFQLDFDLPLARKTVFELGGFKSSGLTVQIRDE
jgi:hypothetical protein